ncbi:MAG: RNA 2',3'-cyclic phosphodiesterase [Hyphomicrobiales bacterium]|nr:MAG: RNA 2',3'-cyclic phosphodiesterase [Hyphomicrobiales bacterium]
MPRLFAGLEIPTDVGLHLSELRGGLRNARWIDVENYHITLRFIGDIDEPTAYEVVSRLSQVNREPVPVAFDGLGSFGSKKPHSVFVRVHPSRELIELQTDIERTLQRIGLKAEGRKFSPHVTIARCKRAAPRDVADWLAVRGYFPVEPFLATRFVLYSSKASSGGGPYLIEEEFPLLRQAKSA